MVLSERVDVQPCVSFPPGCAWSRYWKSTEHKHEVLFLGSRFCSTRAPVCLSHTVSATGGWGAAVPPPASCPWLSWLFWIPHISSGILGSACLFPQTKASQDFDRDHLESVDEFGEYCGLNSESFLLRSRMSPRLFMWRSISVHVVLHSVYKSCSLFAKFTHPSCVPLKATVGGIVKSSVLIVHYKRVEI